MGLLSPLFSLLGWARAEEKRFVDIGAFREYVVQILRSKPGISSVSLDAADPAIIHARYQDNEWTLDVTNIFARLNAYPDEDIDAAVTRFLNASNATESKQVTDDNVVLVIRSRNYIDYLVQNGLTVRHEPLVGDLAAVYMADLPDTMSPLAEDDLADKTPEGLRAIALSNVRKWLPKVASDASLEFCILFYVEDNTFLSTSLILLDEFWKSIENQFPGDVLIALPRTDQLFLFDASNRDAPEMARQIIEATIKDGFNLLSETIYERRDGRLAVFSGN